MTERTPVFHGYYMDSDYDEVMLHYRKLSRRLKKKKAGELIEPTVYEKRAVMKDIRDFIRRKGERYTVERLLTKR